jgi:uncharacterized membrane protein YgdD (TMEM256/DUF423 family)
VPASKAPAEARVTSAVTVVGGVALLVGSAVVAICAGLVSRSAWRPSHVTVPWGLVLGVAGSVSLIVVTRLSAGRRPGYLAAGGWLLGVGAVLFWHPGGDYLFADDGLGYGFLLGATIAVLVAAGWGGPSPDTSQQAPRPRRS